MKKKTKKRTSYKRTKRTVKELETIVDHNTREHENFSKKGHEVFSKSGNTSGKYVISRPKTIFDKVHRNLESKKIKKDDLEM